MEPTTLAQAFDEYSSAVGEVNRYQKVVDDWKAQHPGGDPGGLLGLLGAAIEKRRTALETVERFNKANKADEPV